MQPCTGTEAMYRPTAHRGSRGIAVLFLDHDTRRGEGSASRPGRCLPSEKTRYLLYRRLGGPQGRSGRVRKISSPPGFDPRTVQPVASRYTDYAARPTWKYIYINSSCPIFMLHRKLASMSLLCVPACVAITR